MKKLIAASILCLSSGAVSAQGFYAGVAYSMLDSELSDYEQAHDSEPTAFNVIGGISISSNFSVEFVLGKGLSDDDVGPFDTRFELDQLIGAYGVGIVPVSDRFNFFGKLGIASIEFKDRNSDKSDGNGISYGIGAEVRFTEQFGASLEYVVYPDAEYDDYDVDIETTALNVRLNAYF
ncbi:MAG: hypothetical protein COA99_06590 [Moraxellaceae bacterium]|nr:MAG: hypothetical protein COA99_06590 [Moraxellaceae bacterium]